MWEFYLHFYSRDLQYGQIFVLSFKKYKPPFVLVWLQSRVFWGPQRFWTLRMSVLFVHTDHWVALPGPGILTTNEWKLSIKTLNTIPWTWIINTSYRNMLYPQENIHFKTCFAISQMILYSFTHLSNFNILQLKPSIVTDCKQKTTIFLYIFLTEGICWNINWIINIFLGK